MTIDRVFSWSGAALVLLSVLGVGVALDAPWMLLAGGGMIVAARLVTEGPRGRWLSRRVSLLCTLGAALLGIALIAQQPADPLGPIAIFAVCLTVIKCLERRTMENEAERLVLSFLLVALSAMISVEALFGLIFLLWVPLAILVLLLFQVQHGRTTARGGSQDALPRLRPAGRRARKHLAMSVASNIVLMAGLIIGLFLVLPRGLTPELSSAVAAGVARTSAGNSQRLDLVSGARIISTDTQVARVELRTGPEPLGGILRLRTGTMSDYSGKGDWTPSWTSHLREVSVGPSWTRLDTLPEGASFTLEIELMRPLEWLPVPPGIEQIKVDRFTRLQWDASRGIVGAASSAAPLRYEVQAIAGDMPAASNIKGHWEWHDASVLLLARRILEEAGLPIRAPSSPRSRLTWIDAACDAFVEHLRSGRYQYTLDLRRVGQSDAIRYSTDPVTRFLLEEPVGHCEYFAAGFTALAQSVGIPARIVTGFVAFDRDVEGRWIVRDRDAHAWAEVLTEPGRWEAFDATPSAGPLLHGQEADYSFAARWARLRSAIELWWYGDVMGYDAAAQRMMGDMIFPQWRVWLTDAWRWAGRQRERLDLFFGFGIVGTVWALVVAALALGGGFVLLRRRRRRRRLAAQVGLVGAGRGALAAVSFYGEALRLLERGGHAKPEATTPLAWAEELRVDRPACGDALAWLARCMYRRRFSLHDNTPDAQVELHMNELARALGVRRGRGR
ncbi:MAG: transglutaminaseTgpA domain-containing protein [Phycisphaerales bacterium]|nr:transglutaminaseTgpA domain-containing protein [Phycisphaerales bacterium]